MSIWWVVLVWIVFIIILIVALARRERRMQGIDSHTGQWLDLRLPHLTWQEVLPYIACYLLYTLLVILSIGVFLSWKSVIVALIAAFIEDSRFQGFIYLSSWLFLGLLFGAATLAAENYLRQGISRRQLFRRFVYTVLLLISVGSLGFLIREFALAIVRNR
jgi:hypothetical protein